MDDPRLWSFVADMNFDGSISISDVWLWIKWLYFYPGDGLVYLLLNKAPSIASFFEMAISSYGGVFSGIVSLVFFGIIATASVPLVSAFRESDALVGDKWFWLIFVVIIILTIL